MLSIRNLSAFMAVLVLGCGLIACESGPTPEELQAAQNAEAWAQLQQQKSDLDAKRQELLDARDQLAAAGSEEAEESSEGEEGAEGEGEAPMTAEELQAKAEELQGEVNDLGDGFMSALAEFINNQGLVEGAELTEVQRAAFDMKASEDILVAKEYIDKGGDYQRAIEIYTTSLIFDPTNELLLAAKAEAEELRYMTEERFEQVKKGMSSEEVRALLGIPKASNLQTFDNGVVGWFYPKDPAIAVRAAAGVYFEEKKGELEVYKADYNAIKGESQEEEG